MRDLILKFFLLFFVVLVPLLNSVNKERAQQICISSTHSARSISTQTQLHSVCMHIHLHVSSRSCWGLLCPIPPHKWNKVFDLLTVYVINPINRYGTGKDRIALLVITPNKRSIITLIKLSYYTSSSNAILYIPFSVWVDRTALEQLCWTSNEVTLILDMYPANNSWIFYVFKPASNNVDLNLLNRKTSISFNFSSVPCYVWLIY